MNQKKLITTLLFLSFVFSATAQKVIAHRGYWKTDGSAQNSLAAL